MYLLGTSFGFGSRKPRPRESCPLPDPEAEARTRSPKPSILTFTFITLITYASVSPFTSYELRNLASGPPDGSMENLPKIGVLSKRSMCLGCDIEIDQHN